MRNEHECLYLCILQLRLYRSKVFAGFDVLALCFTQQAVNVVKLRLDTGEKEEVVINLL